MEEKEIKFKTVQEVYDALSSAIEEGYGEDDLLISLPFRDGIGLHYEKVVNVSIHSGIVDIHTTVPDHDDIREKK